MHHSLRKILGQRAHGGLENCNEKIMHKNLKNNIIKRKWDKCKSKSDECEYSVWLIKFRLIVKCIN